MAFNFVYTFKNKEANQPWVTEIRSLPKGISALPSVFKLVVKYDKGIPRILCRIKTLTKDIPLGLVLRALGMQTDLQIIQSVCDKIVDLSEEEQEDIKGMLEIMRYSIEHTALIKQNDCLAMIGKQIDKIKHVTGEN